MVKTSFATDILPLLATGNRQLPATLPDVKLRLFALLLLASTSLFAQNYDLLIRNGRLVDGSGNPWLYADLGIVGDRIAFIGHADPSVTAKRTIDARGLIVAPGFIDMLGQSELNLLIDKQAFSKLSQGITTEITGEGDSVAPMNDAIRNESRDFFQHYKLTPDWLTLNEYFDRLIKQRSGINIGTYVGAATVRRMVLGSENRAPTADELKQMQEMVGDAMSDGAMGLSTALIYAPGNYASTDELIALAKTASESGGIYATHMRNEGDDEAAALEETFRIAREANIPVEIFHLKVSGRQNWGKMQQVVDAIEHARASGLDITADQYPYIASATSLGASIPPIYHRGGVDAFIARLKDPKERAAIRADIAGNKGFENMWTGVGGPAGILVNSILSPDLKRYEGKTVAQIAAIDHKDPLDALIDLVIADHDNTGAVYFSMSEDDMKLALRQPWVSVDNDYGELNVTGPLADQKPHPRAWGSFPRILSRYVREQRVLRLEDAIRKFTSLPAQRLRLNKRGLLRNDYFADITIFDPDKVADVATFEDSNRPSVGIEYVIVNGVVSLEHGKSTAQFAGRPLRGPGYAMAQYAPEGLPLRGAIQGIVTDSGGWPVARVKVSLLDPTGKELSIFETKKDGRYEFPLEQPCENCTVQVQRMGFAPAERKANYNGLNTLYFSFPLERK